MARKRKLKKPYRVMRGVYRGIVVLSALVVVAYFAITLAARPPEMAQAVGNPNEAQPVSAGGEEGTEPGIRKAGSKTRKEHCYTFLLAANDDGNAKADTIMVMRYDVPNQKIGVVSVPRDTVMKTSQGVHKINGAFGKGVENLRDEVSRMVGFPIDFYVLVDMNAFVEVVDAVDGIDFNVPVYMYYHDPDQDLSIHYEPGMQHLTGQQALEVVRFRKNGDGTGYPDSDIGRTKTQQQMIAALAKKVVSWNNVAKMNSFVKIFEKNAETDLKFSDMLYFATSATKLDLNTALSSATLPGDGTKTYRGVKWCYALYQDKSLEILNELVNPYTVPLSLQDVSFANIPT